MTGPNRTSGPSKSVRHFLTGGPVKLRETVAPNLHLTHAYQTWLDHLRVLYPISGVLHVGAGTGASAHVYEEWGVPTVAYIEADEGRFAGLTELVETRAGWTTHCELLSDRSCETTFYRTNSPNENSILLPENFKPLWRNLSTVEQKKIWATTIKEFLDRDSPIDEASAFNWVHIDCLPSLAILRGAGPFLHQWDVVIARTILDDGVLEERSNLTRGDLNCFMIEHGYVCVTHEEEHHPAIGQVLFVRNWKTDLQHKLDSLQKEWEQKTVAVQAQLDELKGKREEQLRLARKRENEVVRLTTERDHQETKRKALQVQVRDLVRACNEKEKEKEQLNTRLSEINRESERLSKQSHEQCRLARKRQNEIVRLTAERDQLEIRSRALQAQIGELARARDEEKKQKNEQLSRFAMVEQEFEKKKEEAEHQRQQLESELAKAEVQIDLIKELLFKEPHYREVFGL